MLILYKFPLFYYHLGVYIDKIKKGEENENL